MVSNSEPKDWVMQPRRLLPYTINAYNVFNMRKAAVGELEQLVLLAVLRLGDNAYTVAIREEIAARAGRRLSRGAVYATLERLERKGLLASSFGEPSPERGGKAKKFFHALPAAIALLVENQQALYAMWDGIDWATEKR